MPNSLNQIKKRQGFDRVPPHSPRQRKSPTPHEIIFAVQVEAAVKKFVYQVVNELDKNHRANDQPDDSPGEGRMFERPESPYGPVKTFELYTSKLNSVLSCLWKRPRATDNFSHSDEVQYCIVPLGKNALGTFMSSISKELKLSQKYTN